MADAPKTAPEPLHILQDNVSPTTLAVQYLEDELGKLFPTIPSAQIKNLPDTLGHEQFWQLVAGISEAFKLNWTYRILSNQGFSWRLEQLSLDDVRMTGMSETLTKVMVEAGWKPSRFASLWRRQQEHAAKASYHGIAPRDSEHTPILIFEKAGTLRVFDGMHRVCAAALGNKTEITAWVGRIKNPNAKPQLNPDKPMFLLAAYREGTSQTPKDLQVVIDACMLFARTHANGRVAVERALGPWEHVANLAQARQKILDVIQ